MADCATAPFQAIVAVPCKNEERRIPHLLQALANQTWCRKARLGVELVANNCTDASVEVARAYSSKYPALDVTIHAAEFSEEIAHVGTARRMAMEFALQRLGGNPNGVILTTDADAVATSDWVEQNVRALATGADVVGGLIIGDPAEEAMLPPGVLTRADAQQRYDQLCDELASYLDPIPHDPWPRHRDHTGGSLAVKATVYQRIGGLPALPYREDLAFVTRLRASGHKLVHPLAVQVVVSARMTGRAPGGMAACLRSWADSERLCNPHLVQPPQLLERRLETQRELRIAGDLFGIELLEGSELDSPGTMPIRAAIAELDRLLYRHRDIPDAA